MRAYLFVDECLCCKFGFDFTPRIRTACFDSQTLFIASHHTKITYATQFFSIHCSWSRHRETLWNILFSYNIVDEGSAENFSKAMERFYVTKCALSPVKLMEVNGKSVIFWSSISNIISLLINNNFDETYTICVLGKRLKTYTAIIKAICCSMEFRPKLHKIYVGFHFPYGVFSSTLPVTTFS